MMTPRTGKPRQADRRTVPSFSSTRFAMLTFNLSSLSLNRRSIYTQLLHTNGFGAEQRRTGAVLQRAAVFGSIVAKRRVLTGEKERAINKTIMMLDCQVCRMYTGCCSRKRRSG